MVSFPIVLLWKVQLSMRQKIGIGSSLCLSLVMVLVAVVRISGVRLPNGKPDLVWLAFWQQQECSIAVTMVSLTAFRSLFVAEPSRRARRPRCTPSYLEQKKMAWNRHRPLHHSDNLSSSTLPAISSTAMSGTRTDICGEPKSWGLVEEEGC